MALKKRRASTGSLCLPGPHASSSTGRGHGAGDEAHPSPSPSPSQSPSPSSASSPSTPPRFPPPTWETDLVGVKGPIPPTKLWRREAPRWREEIANGRAGGLAGPGEHFDRKIIWPPMFTVMNTFLQKDEHDKWKGMRTQELLECFGDYRVTTAHHACGPYGDLGMSVLIFESSAEGYMEAECLHRQFVNEGRGRNAWQDRKPKFVPCGEKQLFGFLTSKKDIKAFNKHCHGKVCLKYEMRSYNEMVVVQMKQRSKPEESLGVITQKLCETMEQNIFVRSKAKEKHLKYDEELKYLEEFFHSQIEDIHKAREAKEKLFEKLLQEERSKARHFDVYSGTTEHRKLRKEHVQKFIACQVKDVAEFIAERAEVIKVHEEKKMKLKKLYMKKELKLKAALTNLIEIEQDQLTKLYEKQMKLKKEYIMQELEMERELQAALLGLVDKHKPDTFEASLASKRFA